MISAFSFSRRLRPTFHPSSSLYPGPVQYPYLSRTLRLTSRTSALSAPSYNMSASSTLETKWEESPLEKESRQAANFHDVEKQLPKRYPRTEMSLVDKLTGILFGSKNPFSKRAKPQQNYVWLLDNTAYQPADGNTGKLGQWQAEYVACHFIKGRKDITDSVSKIADVIGLDGKTGANADTLKRIEERLSPFVWAISPAKTVEVNIPSANSRPPRKQVLGPTDGNGISSQLLPAGGTEASNGKTLHITSDLFPGINNNMRFAGEEGWAILSDIDDTIKITGTTDPKLVLQSTFADVPKPTESMPDFYKVLDAQFDHPAWFYLSASPYNLYPFLREFLLSTYPPGTIILRDASWMYFAGLLQSFTEGVKQYKIDRGTKIHSWLPKRKFICIGDSTQADPESYANLYKTFPGWIKAIYIRKVEGLPHMEQKNRPERFAKTFEGIPEHVWKVFVNPQELADHVKHVAGEAHMGIVGALQAW